VNEESAALYRPVGPKVLALIEAAGFRAFPPRLPQQPIFYPVLNREYAAQIASTWNVRGSGAGFVRRFRVRSDYLAKFDVQTVGAAVHAELGFPPRSLTSSTPASSAQSR
jgi:hypothetical protein